MHSAHREREREREREQATCGYEGTQPTESAREREKANISIKRKEKPNSCVLKEMLYFLFMG